MLRRFTLLRASLFNQFTYGTVLLIALILLSGCTTLKSYNLTSTETLSELTVFQVNGRMAVIQPQQKQSAYFYWRQNNADYKLTVNTFLGINLLTAKRDAQGITITTSDNTYTSPQPQQLLFELTGWWLPLDELHAWFKADVDPSQGTITYYESSNTNDIAQKYIKTFTPFCQQLHCPYVVTISYKNYQPVEQLFLPFSITFDVEGENMQSIRIKIKEWL